MAKKLFFKKKKERKKILRVEEFIKPSTFYTTLWDGNRSLTTLEGALSLRRDIPYKIYLSNFSFFFPL